MIGFATHRIFKLLRTGELFDISHDVLEKHPITAPNPGEIHIRESLRKTLDQFKDARPPATATPRKK